MNDTHGKDDNHDNDEARRGEAENAASGGNRYKLRIDKGEYESTRPVLTGRELLILAGKNPPEGFQIFQKSGSTLIEIKLDDPVDLRKPGVDRFVTLPLDQTEGEVAVAGDEAISLPAERREQRRHFRLPEHDEEFLDSLGLDWETVREKLPDGVILRLVIYDYPVPAGYTVAKVTLYLRIEPTYPDTQIDMVYFLPHLQRRDGRAIGALASEDFDGKTWQRWSRHRTNANPWRAGVDDVSTHLAAVDHWLTRELAKAA
jgi:hypothetical protein